MPGWNASKAIGEYRPDIDDAGWYRCDTCGAEYSSLDLIDGGFACEERGCNGWASPAPREA